MLTACRQSFSGDVSFGWTASARARNVKKNPPILKA